MVGWHTGAPIDAQGRQRVVDFKTTADIWWRKGIDDVEFGTDEQLGQLSYYPGEHVPQAPKHNAETQLWRGLSHQESFQLDVSGFLLLRGVLSAEEASTQHLHIGEDGRDALASNHTLQHYLEAMCGPGFRQDSRSTMLQTPSSGADVQLSAQDGSDAFWGKEYYAAGSSPIFRGARVVWALGASPSTVAVVPASHRSSLSIPTPACVLNGKDDLGAVLRFRMAPGDLLLSAPTLLFGAAPPDSHIGYSWAPDTRAQRASDCSGVLLCCEYACATTFPLAGYDTELPDVDWLSELSPEQRAVVVPRMTGQRVDGEHNRPPPSIHGNEFSGAKTAGIDLEDLWFFDLTGYLILTSIMDHDWLAAANDAYDAISADPEEVLVAVAGVGGPSNVFVSAGEACEGCLNAGLPPQNARCSPRLRGGNQPSGGKIRRDLYSLPKPHSEPFRKMVAYPPVHRWCECLLGPGYRESTDPMGMLHRPGSAGQALHGRPYAFQQQEQSTAEARAGRPNGTYDFVDGRVRCGQINVGWQLHDVGPSDGGFVVIPGSHKATFALPSNRLLSMDLPCIVQPVMKAGDVVLFLGGAVAHGGAAWVGQGERRTVIQFLGTRSGAMPSAKLGYSAMQPRL